VKTVVKTLLIALALCSISTGAVAEEKFRVGVVDGRRVMRDSAPGRANTAILEKYFKERQAKISAEDAKVNAMQKELEKNSLTLTEAQRDAKRKELEEKVKGLRQMARDAEDEFKKKEAELSGEANKVLTQVIDQIAKQKNLNMVLDRNQSVIFWVQDDVDLTEEVIKAYEAQVAAKK
jgi:outer membrane protein